MKAVMEHYGGMIIAVITGAALLLFLASVSYGGERGITGVMGYLAYETLEKVSSQSPAENAFLAYKQRVEPVIYYDEAYELTTGVYIPVENCFQALNQEGENIPVEMVKIEHTDGTEVFTQEHQGRRCFYFEIPGIYKVYVRATDSKNCNSMIMVKVPVNREAKS